MGDARISVVIPTRNRSELCSAAVTSALRQTLPPEEVLVCDDDSEDDTAHTFEHWASREPRLRYLRVGKPGGTPGAARNAGVEASKGDWIAFLDDDDLWQPDKLSRQAPYLEHFDVIAANAVHTNGELYFPLLSRPLSPGRTELIRENLVVNSTAVARRSLIEHVGGLRTDAHLVGIEDYCLWLDLADMGARFLVLPDVVAIYATEASARLSASPSRTEGRLTRHFVERVRAGSRDAETIRATAVHAARLLKLTVRERLGRSTPNP